jgi:hypothetical protein
MKEFFELIADHPFVSVFVLFGTVSIIQAIGEVIEVIVKAFKK